MATYFHGNPEIQGGDGLQTLVLMNPAYVQYHHDAPPPQPEPQQPPHSNLVFLNPAANNLSSPPPQLSHVPPHQQFVGIPLPNSSNSTAPSQDPNDISAFQGLIPRLHYNLYNNVDHHAPAPRDTPRAQQGLSLTLSSQQQPGYGSQQAQAQAASGGSASSGSGVTNGVSGLQGVLLSSKYLKAAQELLDEVVNLNGNGIKSELPSKKSNETASVNTKVPGESSVAGNGNESGGGEAAEKNGAELTTAERQEIQMKKAKLVSMLEEVEQRYRQYHHEMQIVISSFEQAAGIGSAKTYTALALQTISKQFRCLKDAITGQIRAANKSLGEEDSLTGKIEGSRLKFVDHHLRRQRALQHLGMIQHNAWRPQRGLPERSVSVLRAWLFEHFLHPYPKDSDKLMLAKQTGLTRSQVSNWFINARVRLWKPMVEEMYSEEIKEQEQNGGSDDKTSKGERNEDLTFKSTAQQEKSSATVNQTISLKSKDNSANQNAPSAIAMSTALSSPVGGNVRNQSGFSFIGSTELDGVTQGSPKKQRTNEMIQSPTSVPLINMDAKTGEANNEHVSMKFGNERQGRDGYHFMGGQNNFIGGFGQYSIGEIGRFDAEQFTPRFSGNGVSLTLGLPHCENLSLSATHQPFLPNQNIQLGRRVDMGEPNEFGAINRSTPHSSTAYEDMEIQNRKRFVAQLLPDFVA